jgi:CHAT domain-containing protein/Flp pilus assembly protein TadD
MKQKFLRVTTSFIIYSVVYLFPVVGGESSSWFLATAQTSEDLRERANQLEEQGTNFLKTNQVQQVINSWQKVLHIWQQLGDVTQQVRVLENLGKIARLAGKNDLAKQYLQEGLILAQQISNQQAETSILSEIGYIYYLKKDYDKAEALYQKALIIAQKIQDFKQIAVNTGSIGLINAARKNYPQAVQFYQQSLEASKKINSLKDIFTSSFKLGDAYKAQNMYDKAIQSYQQALDYAINLNQPDKIIFSLDELGEVYRLSKNYNLAIKSYQKILEISQEINKLNFQRQALIGLGKVYWEQKNQEKGLQYYQQSLDILLKENKDTTEIVEALRSMGKLYKNLKKYEKAIEQYQKLLEISKENNNVENTLYALSMIGWVYYTQDNNNNRAQIYYEKILDMAQEPKTINEGIAFLTVLAKLYQEKGDNNQANNFRAQAGNIAEENYRKNQSKDALIFLGEIYENDKNYSNAIESYLSLLFQAAKLKDYPALVIATNKLNATYYLIGDCQNAAAFASFHISFARESKNRDEEANGLLRQGNINYCQGKHKEALNSYQEALIIARELKDLSLEGFLLGNIGLVYINLGKYQEAIVNLEQDLAIIRQSKDKNNRQDEGQALGMLGDAYYAQGNYNQAINFYQQSLAIAKEVGYDRGIGLMLTNIGESLIKLKKYSESETTLKEAMTILSDLRSKVGESLFGDPGQNKIAIFERETRTYRLLQKALVQQNKSSEALEIAEASRARILAETLATKSSPSSNITINITYPKLAEIKKIAKEKNATLIEYSIIANREDLNLKDEQELYIWVVQPTGKVEFRQAEITTSVNESLASLITRVRHNIGVRGRSPNIVAEIDDQQSPENLQKLHTILIEPIADLLPTDPNAHVIFMPQGELFLVPFPALQDENGKYLIEKHTILTAPAIQVLDLTQKQRAKVQKANLKGLVIVGNPTMPKVTVKVGDPPEQLKPLPAAKNEAIAIATLLKTTALTGKDATKKTILSELPQAKIIHLATHGLLDDFQSLEIPGAIALAPSDNDNGLLTASEILDLKLNAELVVLSACDTGRGRITGDGVIGLSRSLITAGVPSVIVSLWSVPDAPTAKLMTEFYQNWQEKKLDKAQALRQAMLTTMKNHSNPKDWAAFTLIGEAN